MLLGNILDILIPEVGGKENRHIKLLIEIDVTQPLMRGTTLRFKNQENWISFKYEHLPTFCFYCGCLGHNERICHLRGDDLGLNRLKESQFGPWLRTGYSTGSSDGPNRNTVNQNQPDSTIVTGHTQHEAGNAEGMVEGKTKELSASVGDSKKEGEGEQNVYSQVLGLADRYDPSLPIGIPETVQVGEMFISKGGRQEACFNSEQKLMKVAVTQGELMTINVLPQRDQSKLTSPWMEVLMDDQGHRQQVEERLRWIALTRSCQYCRMLGKKESMGLKGNGNGKPDCKGRILVTKH